MPELRKRVEAALAEMMRPQSRKVADAMTDHANGEDCARRRTLREVLGWIGELEGK